MIIKCRFCQGTGRIQLSFLGLSDELCSVCKGAGELEIAIPEEKLTTCKFCKGEGIIQPNSFNPADITICPACKGIGIVERPTFSTSPQTPSNERSFPQTPRLVHYDYDIAVSYASEDRETVDKYCETISPRARELRIFYDKYDQVNLWGTNLYDKLDEIYRTKALCCVIFISKHYAKKVWTNHERKAAQARALQENIEYILPVRLDDTEIPGIPPTVGYLDLREISVSKLAHMTIEKVKKLKSQ